MLFHDPLISDPLMLHSVVTAVAIHVHLKMYKPPDCKLELYDESPWPHRRKMFQYAGVTKTRIKRDVFPLSPYKAWTPSNLEKPVEESHANVFANNN